VKALTLLLVALLAGSAFAAPSAKAPAEMRLNDFLAKPAYLQSWNALFRGEKDVDAWLARYSKTLNGPTAPEAGVQVGTIRYDATMVCKAHDCGDNRFYVLFAPNGAGAWGVLLKAGKAERFFGKPDEAKKGALRAIAARS
jgi:hypothetical protein